GSDEGHPSAEAPPGQTSRRAPTIDLSASEIEAEPQDQQPAGPEGAGAKSEEPVAATPSRPGALRGILSLLGAGLVGGLFAGALFAIAQMFVAPSDSSA